MKEINKNNDELLDTKQAAALLRLSYSTFARMSMRINEPIYHLPKAYITGGRKKFYKKSELLAWLETRRQS